MAAVPGGDAEPPGVDRWLGALAWDLKGGTYRPRAVRQILIPKKQRGKFRPLGIPCLRDRVAQTAAMLVLSAIFEADLQPEQYAYRPGRGAHDAVRRVHRLLTTGHREVVDADLSDYYDRRQHAGARWRRRVDPAFSQKMDFVLLSRLAEGSIRWSCQSLRGLHKRGPCSVWVMGRASRVRASGCKWVEFGVCVAGRQFIVAWMARSDKPAVAGDGFPQRRWA